MSETKITELTPEQEELIPVYRDRYLKKFHTHKKVDQAQVKEFFTWLYELAGLKAPEEVYIVDSPLAAQDLANQLNGTKNKVYSFSSYGSAWDLGWISFYMYFKEVCGIELDEKFDKYKDFADMGVYDSIQFDRAVIISELPIKIHTLGENVHCSDGPAIEFADGFKVYYWNGVIVPQKLIEGPILKADILSEKNAEIRRCYREKLGAKEYYSIIGGEDGLQILDEDTDNQGHVMRLYRTKFNDDVINSHVIFLECVCPSTGRIYNIYPPDQNVKNVWAAKASTFANSPGKYRHGDVMLVEVGKSFERPLIET